MTEEVFDVCVVGSGAGGGAAAWALTTAGIKTIVLERGPHRRTEDFFHDELDVCRRSMFVPDALRDPHVVLRDGGAPVPSNEAWIATGVGGGTVHMSGYFFRMRDEDFALRTRFGAVDGAEVADWPIEPRTLEPFYDEVERAIGVSGDHAAEGRKTPYPLGPLVTHPSGKIIDTACKSLDVPVFQAARAIVSAPYDGRLACHHCGFCGSYGCEVAAKSSSLVTFLAKAQATGNLTLVPDAMVARVIADPSTRRATEVVYFDGGRKEQRVRARAFVVACSAVETARLLLISGLANSSGLVGRNLTFAAFASGYARYALPSEHFPNDPAALPFIDRATQHYYVAPKGELAHTKAGTILFMLPHKNPIFAAEKLAKTSGAPIFGAALKKKMRDYFLETKTIEWEAFGEFLPHAGCAVTLDPTAKDPFGLPSARIAIALHPASAAASEWLAKKAVAVMDATSPKEQGRFDDRTYNVLQAGTTRMGKDPKTSVCGPTCRAHDVKNLYVADSSPFPSSSGAPWTLTIMANAVRVARAMIAASKRGDL